MVEWVCANPNPNAKTVGRTAGEHGGTMSQGIDPTGLAVMDVAGALAAVLSNAWMFWVLSAVLIAVGCCWGFFGRRRYMAISLVQGIVFGAFAGIWCGTAIEDAIAAGGMTGAIFLGALSQIRICIGAGIGLVIGSLLFALLGRFWSRFFFCTGGGFLGMLVTIGCIRLFSLNMANPLLLVLVMLIAAGALSLWLSYRFPLAFTGIWGGFVFAVGLLYPVFRLFAFIGGPSWLPILAAGGMGVILSVAGISIQTDQQALETQKPQYTKEP